MAIINLQDFSFTYPGAERPALLSISFSVSPGEFITVCGQSGCGKTTLLRNLKPSLSPHGEISGQILFEERSIFSLNHREQTEAIGFVLQNPDAQLVTDKVWHELAFGLESLGLANEEIRGKVAEMASFFGIEDWFYKKVEELSGGQKQLLNLAAIMTMQPKVLVLDEPTSQLDPIAANKFLDVLSRINRELGTTIILSEHRLEEAFAISDRVFVLDKGELLVAGTPREVGAFLKEQEHAMLMALPTAMRVYGQVANDYPCPVTVREGRKWLANIKAERELLQVLSDKQEPKRGNKALELQNVWFRYEKESPDVLRGFSLTVCAGEIFAILGGNGTGKTTALSVMAGLQAPQRGQVFLESVPIAEVENLHRGVVSLLPQNPQTLFVKKDVLAELFDVLQEQDDSYEDSMKKIETVITLCRLEGLQQRHPYDLSGGEQQRLALAKLLLLSPKVLLLDEPTKGLDAGFKEELADILSSLTAAGVAVIMVSHDVEFCARHTDRCGLFFDGALVSQEGARSFFDGKSFYTTAASRMSRDLLSGAVVAEDIIVACGGKLRQTTEKEKKDNFMKYEPTNPIRQIKKKDEKRKSPLRYIGGAFFAVLLFCLIFWHAKNPSLSTWRLVVTELLEMFLLGCSLSCFISFKGSQGGAETEQTPRRKRSFTKRTLLSLFIILLLIPLTMFIGIFFLDDKRYYFISLLIVLETLIPFFLAYEAKKPQARELVVVSVICALAVAGRVIFNAIPQFKPIAALVILSGVAFGGETGFLVGAISAFLSNFYFGQGAWTPWQMFCFGIIGFIAGLLFRRGLFSRNRLVLSMYGFFAIIILYGGILNPVSLFMWQPNPTLEMIVTSVVAGFPFDLIHGAATAFFLWFIAEPMLDKLDRIKMKYGILE